MKIKLFTHTDLDGVGCPIVANVFLGEENVDVVYCENSEVDRKVSDFIQSSNALKYDKIYITDLSVNESVANQIESRIHDLDLQLLDHHPTALWLNKYDWAKVVVENEEGKEAGTSLLYEELKRVVTPSEVEAHLVGPFVERVRRYDTWEWQTKFDDIEPKRLNDLFHLIGRDRFVERFTNSQDLTLSETEDLMLELEQESIDRYVRTKASDIRQIELDNYHIGVVFAERYQSELGNRLSKEYPQFDAIAMVNPAKSISLRTVHDDVNVGAIAKKFGGGGHQKAAGFPVHESISSTFIDILFDDLYYNLFIKEGE